MGGGICGSGLLRAADALLRALGRDTITLLLPATAMAGDAGGQLGLVDPGVQELLISPVVMRELTTGSIGPRRRVEFWLPASVIEGQLPTLGMATGDDLFNAVIGLNHGNELFHVEKVVPECLAGTVCFYVVTAVE
ncbi:MAG TPA: hypothetical protein VE377_13195 [Candidatus Dormibacteraeota bacterium]|nr:hypothetical protein [Candidatus Dormibacteraeota bacterium]